MVQGTVHRRRLFFFLLRTNSLPPLPSPLFPHLPFLSSPSSHLPLSFPSFSPSFRSIGPLSTARGSAERCKLPQCGLGRSPSRQAIWCILESKSGALLAAVFVDFPKNKCNFLHKTSLISYGGSNSSQSAALWGVFLPRQSPPLPYGSRHLWNCASDRVHVGAI